MVQISADKPVVLILGMHRSGTSCLAGELQRLGLHLGDVHVADPFNRKGNRENDRIVVLNNAVLDHSGGAWDRPPDVLHWSAEHERERDAIIESFDVDAAGMWGFKDPRLLLTLPFWLQSIGPRARFVGTFRHPSQVIRSLCSRARMSLEFCHAGELWWHYNLRLSEYATSFGFPLVSFDLPSGQYQASVRSFAEALGIAQAPSGESPGFFDETLRADTGGDDQFPVSDEYVSLHRSLLDKCVHERFQVTA